MDTGKAGDASPWRIKVTVEAEPKDESSPSRKTTRTTKVPLKRGSSSPVKKSGAKTSRSANMEEDEGEVQVRRPQRKRKGTPIRRRNTKSQTAGADPMTEEDDVLGELPPNMSSPAKRPAARSSKRRSSPKQPTGRSTRLSQAREELDHALNDAIGRDLQSEEDLEDDVEDVFDVAGDMTVANEDFTMVSFHTLQSMKGNTSQLLEHSGLDVRDKTGVSVSYMPSSPPQVHRVDAEYPNITSQAQKAKESVDENIVYDAMSWKPTGPQKTTAVRTASQQQQQLDSEPTEWRLDRQAVSQEIENARTSRVIVIDDDTQAGAAAEPNDDAGVREEDIWAEEASRSLEEDDRPTQPTSRSPQLEDLFSDQPLKPPRSKIPRTWRRTSGMDFSYVDSPEYGVLKTRRKSATSTEGEAEGAGSRSSGVLTPPSTDDDVEKTTSDRAEGEGDTSLTQPDAAATQLQDREQYAKGVVPPIRRNEALSPDSDSSSSDTSPDGEDTGMFWQTHLPNIYERRQRPRPQRQRAMDLSELLNLNKSSSPAKQSLGGEKRKRAKVAKSSPRSSPLGMGVVEKRSSAYVSAVESKARNTSHVASKEKVVNSPLRKSLLNSSKIGGSVLPSQGTKANLIAGMGSSQSSSDQQHFRDGADEVGAIGDTFGDSFESKASDQRQLLAEMTMASAMKEFQSPLQYGSELDHNQSSDDQSVSVTKEDQYDDQFLEKEPPAYEDGEGEEESEEAESDHPSRSYEERLNLESPQKIRVKFNDSEGNSSMLAPKKEYPPLFGQARPASATKAAKSPPSVTLVSKKTATSTAQAQQGIFSRLSTSFWSAVVRPSGPILVEPKEEPVYSLSLRALIRSRYGVLSDQHPWTMAHMRTLHRLLNSCTSGRHDSVVPKSGPLPNQLETLVGKELQCVTDFRWTFTEQHAHVVDAFMQVLVASHVADSMRRGEIEFIGDHAAKEHRGMMVGRHGDDLVWKDVPGVKLPKGQIWREYVVKALGNCVMANIETARKERVEAEESRKRKEIINRQRKEWERSIGIESGDDEESDEDEDVSGMDDGEMLQRVRRQ